VNALGYEFYIQAFGNSEGNPFCLPKIALRHKKKAASNLNMSHRKKKGPPEI